MRNSLPELRRDRGYSQEELARLVEVSRQTIISIERERYSPSLALAFRLAELFETSIEAIFRPD